MGTKKSAPLVDRGLCHVFDLDSSDALETLPIDLIVLCSQEPLYFRSLVEKLISYYFFKIAEGKTPKILLPNPDVIYPKGGGEFGMASGMVLSMLEKAVKIRYPSIEKLPVIFLGKPGSYIFEKAICRSGAKKALMIGDQMETDIRGAKNLGIDSALVSSGVVEFSYLKANYDFAPNYFLKDLEL